MANAKGRAAPQGPESLYVQGFQVFEERTRIPLRRLTFLFGPNSAGKSGVEDALVVLRDVVLGSEFDGTFAERFARLRRHWRRTGEGAFDYAPLLALGYVERVSKDIARLTKARLRGESTPFYVESDVLREVELSARFRCGNFAESEHEWDPELLRDLEVAIDGDGIVSMFEFEKFGVNCGHAILSGLAQIDDYIGLSESWPAFVEVKGSWVYFKGDWVRVDANKHVGKATLGRQSN